MALSSRPLALPLLSCGVAHAQDISVSQLGIHDGQEDYVYWGASSGIHAYSVATTACNVGTVNVSWRDHLKDAPIIGTNMFRMTSEGSFEQLGYSFVKYSTCGWDEAGNGCPGPCNPDLGCSWLTPNCSDTYWADLNDGKQGGAKWEIEPTTGVWPAGSPQGPIGDPLIRGRLQVHDSEMQDAGALYFVEAQYISGHDQTAGNGGNNYAWRRISFNGPADIDNAGPTIMGDAAIHAWQAHANDVLVSEALVQDEGGAGVHGWMFLGSRAVDLGGGLWRYQYALQNGNSQRAAGGLKIPLPCDGAAVSDLYFHGVEHHSGSPYSNDDWTATVGATDVSWATVDYAVDAFGNAVHWGELHTFAFTVDRAPATTQAEISLFIPGTPSTVMADVIAPGGSFTNYCAVNPNSTGQPAAVSAQGSPFVSDNDLRFEVVDLPLNVPGYFMMSQSTAFVPLFGGSSGNLCLGPPQIRFSNDVLFSGPVGTMSFAVDNTDLPSGSVFDPGDTWYFQLWYRDPPTSNTTEGVTVSFCN